jgi:hypothetical protein
MAVIEIPTFFVTLERLAARVLTLILQPAHGPACLPRFSHELSIDPITACVRAWFWREV